MCKKVKCLTPLLRTPFCLLMDPFFQHLKLAHEGSLLMTDMDTSTPYTNDVSETPEFLDVEQLNEDVPPAP